MCIVFEQGNWFLGSILFDIWIAIEMLCTYSEETLEDVLWQYMFHVALKRRCSDFYSIPIAASLHLQVNLPHPPSRNRHVQLLSTKSRAIRSIPHIKEQAQPPHEIPRFPPRQRARFRVVDLDLEEAEGVVESSGLLPLTRHLGVRSELATVGFEGFVRGGEEFAEVVVVEGVVDQAPEEVHLYVGPGHEVGYRRQ